MRCCSLKLRWCKRILLRHGVLKKGLFFFTLEISTYGAAIEGDHGGQELVTRKEKGKSQMELGRVNKHERSAKRTIAITSSFCSYASTVF